MLTSSLLSKLKLCYALDVSASLSTVLITSKASAALCLRPQPTRSYAFKSDLKIKWVRPKKIESIRPEKSGDLSPLPKLAPTTLHEDFVDCKAIEELSEEQKKLYTLGFLPRRKTFEMLRNQAVTLVQRHSLDMGSMESKIALQTVKIRSLQKHMQTFPKDKKSKVSLNELIDRRKKFLKYLRRWDYKRFEWLLEKLDIVYHPPPEEYHWVTRKDSLCKLTQEHCDNIRETRLAAYRHQLEAEKEKFEQEKVEILRWIAEEERACGVAPSQPEPANKAA